MLSRVKIFSPLTGYIWPLERVPDPVFAHGMFAGRGERFRSTINLRHGNKKVPAGSVTAIGPLEVTHRAKVQVLASGADTKAAVEQLEELLAQGCGDAGHVPASATATTTISLTAAPAPIAIHPIRNASSGSKVIP